MMNFINNLNTSSNDSMVIVLVLLLLLSVAIYLIVLYNKPSTKKFTIISVPINLKINNNGNNEFKLIKKSKDIPEDINGERFAYSFWVYLQSTNESDEHSLIFSRTTDDFDVENPTIIKNSTILAYIRKNTNSMIIKLRTKNSTVESNPDASDPTENNDLNKMGFVNEDVFTSIDDSIDDMLEFKLDYIPLQRWVNIIVNINGNLSTLFVDGRIHSTSVANNNKIVKMPEGKVILGGDENLNTTNGYLSRLEFFDYAFTSQNQVNKIYKSGPVSQSILQRLGITEYGVRSPLYKIDLVKDN
jgi:hypothetical protein